jgi:hypothetical protein
MLIMNKTVLLALFASMSTSALAVATSDRQIEKVASEIKDSIEVVTKSIKSTNARYVPSPVGVKGDFVSRGYYNKFGKNPGWASAYDERSYLDGDFNLKFVVNPNPFFTVWSTVTFGYDFSGNYLNDAAYGRSEDQYSDNYRRVSENRNPQRENVGIFEELIAGTDVRTKHVKLLARVGSALWVEQSPLTIWRRDPNRRFAWYFESYESERPAAGYYGQKSFSRNAFGGRSTWPRRTFGGIHLDFYSLPGGTYFEFLLAEANAGLKPSFGRGATNSNAGDAEALGAQSHSSKVWAGRLGNRRILGGLGVSYLEGLDIAYNFMKVRFNDEIIVDYVDGPSKSRPKRFIDQFLYITTEEKEGSFWENPFVVEPEVHSIDIRGNLNPYWYIHADIGLSREIRREWKPKSPITYTSFGEDGTPVKGDLFEIGYTGMDSVNPILPFDLSSDIDEESQNVALAASFKIVGGRETNHTIEGAYIDQNFNTPYGQTQYTLPVYKDNIRLGAGTFGFQQNLKGLNYTIKPKLPNGFLKFSIGEYSQVASGADAVRFQHKLMGRDLWKSSFSWSKTDPTRTLTEGNAYRTERQNGRLGNSSLYEENRYFGHNSQGGYYGDDLSLWEEFAVYNKVDLVRSDTLKSVKVKQGNNNTYFETSDTAVFIDDVYETGKITSSRKHSHSLALDFGYDLAKMWKGDKRVFFNLYSEWNAISSGWNPADNIIQSTLLMTEPVFQLHDRFYLIGLAGIELFQSDGLVLRNTVNNNGTKEVPEAVNGTAPEEWLYDVQEMPIDYTEYALGIGFDWDFSDRAGLHFRYKFAKHIDHSVDNYNDGLRAELSHLEEKRRIVEANGGLLDANEVTRYKMLKIDTDGGVDARFKLAKQGSLPGENLPKSILEESYSAHYFFVETKVWF